LRCQHHAPMGCNNCSSALLCGLTNRTPRPPVINRRHVAIKVKRRAIIKPAYLGGAAKEPSDSTVAAAYGRANTREIGKVSRFA
jgi:hypothetical protein